MSWSIWTGFLSWEAEIILVVLFFGVPGVLYFLGVLLMKADARREEAEKKANQKAIREIEARRAAARARMERKFK